MARRRRGGRRSTDSDTRACSQELGFANEADTGAPGTIPDEPGQQSVLAPRSPHARETLLSRTRGKKVLAPMEPADRPSQKRSEFAGGGDRRADLDPGWGRIPRLADGVASVGPRS